MQENKEKNLQEQALNSWVGDLQGYNAISLPFYQEKQTDAQSAELLPNINEILLRDGELREAELFLL